MPVHKCAKCGYARNTNRGLAANECNCSAPKQAACKYSGDCGCGCDGILGEKQSRHARIEREEPVALHQIGVVPSHGVHGRLEGGRTGATGVPLRESSALMDFETVGRYTVVDTAEEALGNTFDKWAASGLHRGRLLYGRDNGARG